MNPELHITILEKPDDAAWEVIGGGITAFNLHHAGSDAATPLCVVLRDEAGETLGGNRPGIPITIGFTSASCSSKMTCAGRGMAKNCSSAPRRKPARAG